jgi:radical SAM/Cys-rich protein
MDDIDLSRDRPSNDFDVALQESRLFPLTATGIEVLQINFGKLCNQACRHCHVEAGPTRAETISLASLDACLGILSSSNIPVVDMTGGAPELNSHFRWFVEQVKALGRRMIVRSNLSIVLEPGLQDLPRFYRDHGVEVVASLPYYLERNVDAQRGEGVFHKSIEALRRLNRVGYGIDGSGLVLDLVYNPGGAFLPPPQASIERDFKRELDRRYGISFNRVLTIANMPLGRFLHFLRRTGQLESYMKRLIDAYNPPATAAVMCRYTLSVGWDGTLYDCDFNQMLELRCNHGAPTHLRAFDFDKLEARRIVTGMHCYGCTAGAGSSCGGAVLDQTDRGESPC